MNEPLTLQELVELNGQSVWVGEPFNQWVEISFDPKDVPNITPEMKIRKGVMNVNGERVELLPANFYREPNLTRQERIEKMRAGGDYRPEFTCGDCSEWHKTVCSGNCRKNVLEWLEQYKIENCKEE